MEKLTSDLDLKVTALTVEEASKYLGNDFIIELTELMKDDEEISNKYAHAYDYLLDYLSFIKSILAYGDLSSQHNILCTRLELLKQEFIIYLSN